MDKRGNPCYMCERRQQGCHSSCEDYKKFSQVRAERGRLIRKKRAENEMVTSILVKAAEKTKERKR